MPDQVELLYSIIWEIISYKFSKKETEETKKCKHCLRRIKIDYHRCPYCQTTAFIYWRMERGCDRACTGMVERMRNRRVLYPLLIFLLGEIIKGIRYHLKTVYWGQGQEAQVSSWRDLTVPIAPCSLF
jgi:hypothetical protein